MIFKNKNNNGFTLIELLIYTGIFLVIVPVLVLLAVNSFRGNQSYNAERTINADGQFLSKRIYDLIADAKQVDASDSRFNQEDGRISLVMQDDSVVVIELNEETQRVEITEQGQVANLSSAGHGVERLYFEKITDEINDPEIFLGVNFRMKLSSDSEVTADQDYVLSANLERGDFDSDNCPDFIDRFPRHAECCGDSDVDGICDELDNCVMAYNPFQEDYDEDLIGDQCDQSVFLGEGGGGGGGGAGSLGSFNCSPDEQLLNLIYQEPPLPSSTLKQILQSSTPLPPTVLDALIDEHPLLTDSHFMQVFVPNVKLTDEVYDSLVAMNNISGFYKFIVMGAHLVADFVPWLGENNLFVEYQLEFLTDDTEEPATWTNRIRYYDADNPLCNDPSDQKSDIFVLSAEDGNGSVEVTTVNSLGSDTNTLTLANNYLIDSNGYALELNEQVGNTYAILVSSASCTEPLDSVEFDFGLQSNVIDPPSQTSSYDSSRYTSYCSGGCDIGCGDVGTGIITRNIFSDRCYLYGETYPEWCSNWYTFEDDDTDNPAFVGGTQTGQQNAYWEKTFKNILTAIQLENLESITVVGEVAYQNITQFFCDTLASSCPMDATLVEPQEVQLYNYLTEEWETIGEMSFEGVPVVGDSSDQQLFEVIYDDETDVQKFFGGPGNSETLARIQFNWDGVPPGEVESAPAFMLIDYFTIHLKW